MALAAPGLAGAGGLLGSFSAISGGEASKKSWDYKAGVAQVNQQIADQNRDYAFATGGKEATKFGQTAGQRMGKITTAQGSSGFDLNSGSAGDVRASQRTVDLADEKQIHENAARRAYGYIIQGEGFRNEAVMDKAAGENARTSGVLGAATSLVSAATSVASKWYQGSQSGLWGGTTDPWKGIREDDTGSNNYSMS